jgi:hypothetical protein
MLKLYEQYPSSSLRGPARDDAESAVSSAKMLQDAEKKYTPAVAYPDSSFGSGLSVLAEAVVQISDARGAHYSRRLRQTHNNQAAEHQELDGDPRCRPHGLLTRTSKLREGG